MKKLTGFLAGMVLILLPLVVYQPSFKGGFLWDDDAHVTRNLTIQDPGGLSRIWLEPGSVPQYYPLAHTSFWVQYQLWGDWSTGYRLTNALLHGLSCLLVWLILRRLGVPGAWVAAAIFAVHPVQVESVAWISELKNLQSGLFYLAALWMYLLFAWPLDQPPPARRRWWLYGLVMLFFAAALLSKTVTATLPAVILLLLWWKRPRLIMRDITPLIPLFVIGIGLGLVTILMEKHFVGAQGAHFDFSPIDRILIAGRALWFYAGKILWPHPLMFFYPRWSIDPTSLLQYLYPLTAAAVMATLFILRGKIGRGPLVAVLFFAGTLMPALGFFDVYPFVYSFVADHFQYLASLGMIVLVVGVATTLAQRQGLRGRRAGQAMALVVICLLGGVTWVQCQAYLSGEALYRDVIAKNPRAWMAMNNLANLYIKQDRWDEARTAVTRSLAVNANNDRAHNTMAVVDKHFGQLEDAVKHYDRSLHLNPGDPATHMALARLHMDLGRYDLALTYLDNVLKLEPDRVPAYILRGNVRLKAGDYEAAFGAFRHALELDPRSSAALWGMGQARDREQRTADAQRYYRDSLKIDPNQPQVENNLGTLLGQTGKYADAAKHYRLAVTLDPTFLVARKNLAKTLAHINKPVDAAVEYARILQEDPTDITAMIAVADAHVAANEFEQAMAGYRQAIKLDPLNAMAHNNLGVVLMMQGNDQQAAEHVQSALRLKPDLTDAWFNLGLLNLRHGRLEAASRAFEQILKLDPQNGPAHFQLGWIDENQKDDAAAIAHYRRAIELMPKESQVKERLAWVLATTTIPGVRSPQEAIELANEAVRLARPRTASVYDTLGVAQASAGLYPPAIVSANRALKMAKDAGQKDQAQAISLRITLYKAHQPYVAMPVPAATPVTPSATAPATRPAPAPTTAPAQDH